MNKLITILSTICIALAIAIIAIVFTDDKYFYDEESLQNVERTHEW